MAAFTLRILALLLVFATAVPSAAFARNLYFCRMMDRVMTSECCCGHDDERRGVQSASPELRAGSCCDLLPVGDREAIPATRGANDDWPLPAFLAVAPSFDLLPEHRVAQSLGEAPRQARAPPPERPPLFLLNCVFLT